MKTVLFEIPGPIKGKARPRVTKTGIAYTPKDTVQYENLVRVCYQEQAGQYLNGPLKIEIDVFFEIPKSTAKRRKVDMLKHILRPTKKPDWDNIGKVICDSLNGTAYHDDAAIVSASVNKWYTEEASKVRVCLSAWEE